MRLIGGLLIAAAAALLFAWLAGGAGAAVAFHWAAEQQRAVQNAMATALRAIRAGDPWALASLCLLSGAYGFVHALGPGHGKVLLGSVALTAEVPLRRMLAVGLAASLAQAGVAIILVSVGVGLLSLTSAGASDLAEGWMAHLSRWAIAAIGVLIAWRGLRGLWQGRHGDASDHHRHHHHHHDHDHSSQTEGPAAVDQTCGCGHAHGPTAAQLAALTSWRAVLALIVSIAIRPCSGALFLLVIAFRFHIPGAGILAVLAMGLGTALFNSLAIGGGMALQRLAALGAWAGPAHGRELASVLQLTAGLTVVLLTLALGL
jgi:nickel/cobalt transporter (NicO) family protein